MPSLAEAPRWGLIIFVVFALITIVSITHNVLQNADAMAQGFGNALKNIASQSFSTGWLLVTGFSTNFVTYYPLYLLFGLPTIFHFFRRSQWKRQLRNTIKDAGQKAKDLKAIIEKANADRVLFETQRKLYEQLKSMTSEMTTPCGQIVSSSQQTIMLQTVCCKNYAELSARKEAEIKSLNRKNVDLLKENRRMARRKWVINPKPDQIKEFGLQSLQERDEDIKMLKSYILGLDNLLQARDRQIDHLEGNLKAASKQRDGRQEVQQLQKLLKNAQEGSRRAQDETKVSKEQAIDSARTVEQEKQELIKKIAEFEREEAEYVEQIDCFNVNIVELNNKLDSVKQANKGYEKENLSLKRQLAESEKALDGKKLDTLDTIRGTALDVQSATITELQNKLQQQVEECSNQKKTQQIEHKSELARLRLEHEKEIGEEQKKTAEVSRERDSEREKVAEAVKLRDDYQNLVNETNKKIVELEAQPATVPGTRVEDFEEYRNVVSEGNRLFTQNQSLEKQVSRLQALIPTHNITDEAITRATTTHAALQQAFAELQLQIVEKDDHIAKAGQIIAERETTIAQQNVTIESLSDNISPADEKLLAANEKLKRQVRQVQDEKNDLERRLHTKEQEIFEKFGTDIAVAPGALETQAKAHDDAMSLGRMKLAQKDEELQKMSREKQDLAITLEGSRRTSQDIEAKAKKEVAKLNTDIVHYKEIARDFKDKWTKAKQLMPITPTSASPLSASTSALGGALEMQTTQAIENMLTETNLFSQLPEMNIIQKVKHVNHKAKRFDDIERMIIESQIVPRHVDGKAQVKVLIDMAADASATYHALDQNQCLFLEDEHNIAPQVNHICEQLQKRLRAERRERHQAELDKQQQARQSGEMQED